MSHVLWYLDARFGVLSPLSRPMFPGPLSTREDLQQQLAEELTKRKHAQYSLIVNLDLLSLFLSFRFFCVVEL